MPVENSATLSSKQPRAVTPPSREKRPFGLKAIIFLLALQIVAGILLIVDYIYNNSNIFANVLNSLDDAEWFLYIMVLQPIIIVARLVAIVGLWRRRRWAWYLTMFLVAYSMATDLVTYFQGEANYFMMVLNVITVLYLNLREVQSLFIDKTTEAKV